MLPFPSAPLEAGATVGHIARGFAPCPPSGIRGPKIRARKCPKPWTASLPWKPCASPRPPPLPPPPRSAAATSTPPTASPWRPCARPFPSCNIDGTVVIGEGEMDEAPMLYIGEKVGHGGVAVDIAVDPLEGTNLTAKALPNALAVHGHGRARHPAQCARTCIWTRSRSAAAIPKARSISMPTRWRTSCRWRAPRA